MTTTAATIGISAAVAVAASAVVAGTITGASAQPQINTLKRTKQSISEKGQPNGYASLDSSGIVPTSQLPFASMIFRGNWDAATNTPTLADGTGQSGDVYRVSVGGTQNLGSGVQTFDVGNLVIYNGTIWQQAPVPIPAGILSVSGGGTGRSTLTAHALVVGDDTNPVSLVGPAATAGQPLLSAGAASDPAFASNFTFVNNTLSTSNTNGDINLVPNGTGIVAAPTIVQAYVVSATQQLVITHRTVTTTPYTIASADIVVGMNVSGSASTVNLPAASANAGRVLMVGDESGAAQFYPITIVPNGADTILGSASVTLNGNYNSATLLSNGTNMWIVL